MSELSLEHLHPMVAKEVRLWRESAARKREDARRMMQGRLSTDRLVRFDEPQAVTQEVMEAALRLYDAALRCDAKAAWWSTRRVTGHC